MLVFAKKNTHQVETLTQSKKENSPVVLPNILDIFLTELLLHIVICNYSLG